MSKARDLIPFKEQPEHVLVTQFTGDDFTRLHFYNGKPFDFGIFITRKNAQTKKFDLEYFVNVEDGKRHREERDNHSFDSSKLLVEYINFKLTMLCKDGF